jgi:hypothetical protein
MARSSLIAFSWISSLSLVRRTACARAHFSGCSSTTNAHGETGQMVVCCQNLMLGVLSSRSALSVLVGALFKKFGLFLNTPSYVWCWNFNNFENISEMASKIWIMVLQKHGEYHLDWLWKINRYYLESGKKERNYIRRNEGGLDGLAIYCAGTAIYNMLMTENRRKDKTRKKT